MLCLMQCQGLELVQTQELEPIGGVTESVFVKAEEYLMESSKHQEWFRKFVPKSRQKKYRSMLDCLFCEVFPQERPDCFKFYRGEGRRLVYIAEKEQIVIWDGILLGALMGISILSKRRRKMKWQMFCTGMQGVAAC